MLSRAHPYSEVVRTATLTATEDDYRLLGLERGATADEIKKAWRRVARATHPESGGTQGLFEAADAAHKRVVADLSREDDVLDEPTVSFASEAPAAPWDAPTASEPRRAAAPEREVDSLPLTLNPVRLLFRLVFLSGAWPASELAVVVALAIAGLLGVGLYGATHGLAHYVLPYLPPVVAVGRIVSLPERLSRRV